MVNATIDRSALSLNPAFLLNPRSSTTGGAKRRQVEDEDYGEGLKHISNGEDTRVNGGDASDVPGTSGKKVSERRRGQNRAAQRHFREKKEKHTSSLEERVGDLEKDLSARVGANDALKQLLASMQEENLRLRTLGEAPQPIFGVGGEDDGVTSFDFSFSSSANDSFDTSQFNIPPSGLPTPPDTHQPGMTAVEYDYSLLPSPAAPSLQYKSDNSLFSSSLSPVSSGGGADSSASSTRLPSTPPSFGKDYRDVADSIGFDFGESTTTELDDFAASFLPSIVAPEQKIRPSSILPLSCTELPYKFDVDGLCSDLKAKATCQEMARRALAEAIEEDQFLISQSHPLG